MANAGKDYATQQSQQGSSDPLGQPPQISLTSPIAVPSDLGMELPEFSLSYADIPPIADLDRISDRTRPSSPLTIAIGTSQKRGTPAVSGPVGYPQQKKKRSQGNAKDLLPLVDAVSPGSAIGTTRETQVAGYQAFVQKNKHASKDRQVEATVVGQGIGQDGSSVDDARLQKAIRLQQQLENLEAIIGVNSNEGGSPGLTVGIPSGFGADNNTIYTGASFQERARGSDMSDAGFGLGVGLGDARKSVGVELSYAFASLGTNTRDFGSGGFNVKVHRRVSEDLAVAGGINGLITLGDETGLEDTFYGVATKIFRTDEDIDKPFSRIAVTAGIGTGQFRTQEALLDDKTQFNVFGNVAFRVARRVSIITEWSGQDFGVGVSIAPLKNIPLVITPALRDIAGSDLDGARLVLGGGVAHRF
ncbi:MAG: hypothetical protein EBE86_009885 [Hormoscilla sp. GUM202]|nr:hypothetical protein [Hormoscilla sp. GUM202]